MADIMTIIAEMCIRDRKRKMVKFYERLGQTARCNVVGIIGRQHSCLTGDIPLKRPYESYDGNG